MFQLTQPFSSRNAILALYHSSTCASASSACGSRPALSHGRRDVSRHGDDGLDQ
jgi:hypothetical protein